VYVMKESTFHYHLYAREAEVDYKNERIVLESYRDNITSMIEKYPLQWFNYFDFWSKP